MHDAERLASESREFENQHGLRVSEQPHRCHLPLKLPFGLADIEPDSRAQRVAPKTRLRIETRAIARDLPHLIAIVPEAPIGIRTAPVIGTVAVAIPIHVTARFVPARLIAPVVSADAPKYEDLIAAAVLIVNLKPRALAARSTRNVERPSETRYDHRVAVARRLNAPQLPAIAVVRGRDDQLRLIAIPEQLKTLR